MKHTITKHTRIRNMKEPVGQLKGDHCNNHKYKPVYLSRRKKKKVRDIILHKLHGKLTLFPTTNLRVRFRVREMLKREKPTSGIN